MLSIYLWPPVCGPNCTAGAADSSAATRLFSGEKLGFSRPQASRSRRNPGGHEPNDHMPLIICQCRIGPSPPARYIPAQSAPATRDVCLATGQHEGRALYTPSRRLLTACQAQTHFDATEQSVDDTPDR